MLKAAGISLALPWMESLMGAQDKLPPKRFCSIYFPCRVSLPNQNSEFGHGTGFPRGRETSPSIKSLEPLEPYRNQVTVMGLSHLKFGALEVTCGGDTFLAGEEMSLRATGLKIQFP